MKFPEILDIVPEPVVSRYDEKDAIFYALSIGMGSDPENEGELDVCFSAPVYPGETLVFHFWRDGATVAFECNLAERPVTVLKNGRCLLAPGAW